MKGTIDANEEILAYPHYLKINQGTTHKDQQNAKVLSQDLYFLIH